MVVSLSLLIHQSARATDITIRLPGNKAVTRQTVDYTCDGSGVRIGVPPMRFSVEYISGSGNSLVVVPIHGGSLIFVNVPSASGARYVAQQYTWWESGGHVTLLLDAINGEQRATCRKQP